VVAPQDAQATSVAMPRLASLSLRQFATTQTKNAAVVANSCLQAVFVAPAVVSAILKRFAVEPMELVRPINSHLMAKLAEEATLAQVGIVRAGTCSVKR
jgi:hypothetical protein